MLTHKGTRTMETQRLILRRFEAGDVPAVFDNWANDAQVCRYVNFQPHGTPEMTREVVGRWVLGYKNVNFYHWAIVPKQLGQAAGSISVVQVHDTNQVCEVGYCLGRQWWNQGLMTEALRAVIDYIFNEIGYNRIEARYDTRNPASGRVMEKSGMIYEGTMRQDKLRRDGTFGDRSLWAILREDWLKTR